MCEDSAVNIRKIHDTCDERVRPGSVLLMFDKRFSNDMINVNRILTPNNHVYETQSHRRRIKNTHLAHTHWKVHCSDALSQQGLNPVKLARAGLTIRGPIPTQGGGPNRPIVWNIGS